MSRRGKRPEPSAASRRTVSTVLVGSTLDPDSDRVVRCALSLARAFGARLSLVHSLEASGFLGRYQGDLLGAEQDRALLDSRRVLLASQAERLGIEEGERGELALETGPAHRALLTAAERLGADLLVVGARTEAGRFEKLLGSTADRVVRKAECPVLVVRGELAVPPRRVLAPVDLSLLSCDALRCGLGLLAQLAGGSPPAVEALLVTSPEEEPAAATHAARPPQDELRRFVESAGRDLAQRPEMRVRRGEVRGEILAELAARPADLVMIGTHGRGGFDRFLLGSVAAGIVRESPASVLLIPPEASLGRAIADAILEQTTPDWDVELQPEGAHQR